MNSIIPDWTPPAAEKKSRSFKWILIIAVSIVIFLGAIAYYFYIYKSSTGTKVSEPQNTTGDWATYTNNIYGFSLEYPKKWLIDEKDQADIKFNRQIAGDATLQTQPPVMAEVKGAILENNQEISDWISKELSNKVINSKEYIIGGKQGILITKKNENQAESLEVFLIADLVKYRLIQGEASKDDFNKLSESFKLVAKVDLNETKKSQNTTTSDLTQTFTNEKYGISIKYPTDWVANDETSIESQILLRENFTPKESATTKLFEFKVSTRSVADELAIYKAQIADQTITTDSPAKIGSINATKITSTKNQIETTAYLTKHGEYVYIIIGQSKNPNSKYSLYFDQMISSVNFLKI